MRKFDDKRNFAVFRRFSLIFDEILRISFSLLLISTVRTYFIVIFKMLEIRHTDSFCVVGGGGVDFQECVRNLVSALVEKKQQQKNIF